MEQTIKERAEAFAKSLSAYSILSYGGVSATLIANYVKIAEEQKRIDIDKACEWLEKYMERLGYIDEWCRSGEAEFIKAMEKEREL